MAGTAGPSILPVIHPLRMDQRLISKVWGGGSFQTPGLSRTTGRFCKLRHGTAVVSEVNAVQEDSRRQEERCCEAD